MKETVNYKRFKQEMKKISHGICYYYYYHHYY